MKTQPVQYETGQIYELKDLREMIQKSVSDGNVIGKRNGVRVYNVPCSFDIETTSFYQDGNEQLTYEQVRTRKGLLKDYKAEKRSIMYIWQLGINGNVVTGRTWNEFLEACNVVSNELGLNKKRKLIVYVHNLSYEFQFLCKLFDWEKVFSLDERKPVYALTKSGIEFRCSYLLSGYSLSKLSGQLQRYKVAKMVGDLDYSLHRHSGTPLTEKEMGYCINDIRVVMAYIQEKIENEGNITNIPITKTGYVRKYCREACMWTHDETGKREKRWEYIELMDDLKISGMNEFNMLLRSFQGGFTHANAYYTGDIVKNVGSYDFTSSYPYVMVAEQFPMSRGVKVEITSEKDFNNLINDYCCVFDIQFIGLQCTETQDMPLSVSKCFQRSGVVENNGRVVAADSVSTTITNVDFHCIKMFYTWESIIIGEMYVYKRGYLPAPFVKSILKLYSDKTVLKGVEGKEVEYLASKEMVNACYGMTVTNPLRDEYIFADQWETVTHTESENEELLHKYNESRNRFLFYPWGIFVTAYARRNLFTGIYSMGDDYVYSDTDSLKMINPDNHTDYFQWYNGIVEKKLKEAAKFHDIPFSMFEPKTIEGDVKRLGIWDFEGIYTRFKTLGAKRYMIECENALKADGKRYPYSITVSGVNKFKAIPWMFDKFGNKAMENFSDALHLPPEACGKNIHTYIDYPVSGIMCDYLGNVMAYSEQSGVHLEPTDYHLSLSVMYLDYLKGLKNKVR